MQNHDGRKEKCSPDRSEILFFTEEQMAFPENASTENRSARGARLLTRRPLKPNASISVKFPKSEWVQVVYCEKVPDKSFAIGMEFLHPQPTGVTRRRITNTRSTPQQRNNE